MCSAIPKSGFESSAMSLFKDTTLGIANMDSFKGLTAGSAALSMLDDLNIGVAAGLANGLNDSISEISTKVGDRIARL